MIQIYTSEALCVKALIMPEYSELYITDDKNLFNNKAAILAASNSAYIFYHKTGFNVRKNQKQSNLARQPQP